MPPVFTDNLLARKASRETQAALGLSRGTDEACQKMVRSLLLAQRTGSYALRQKVKEVFTQRYPGEDWDTVQGEPVAPLLISGPPGSGKVGLFQQAVREVARLLGLDLLINPGPQEDVRGRFVLAIQQRGPREQQSNSFASEDGLARAQAQVEKAGAGVVFFDDAEVSSPGQIRSTTCMLDTYGVFQSRKTPYVVFSTTPGALPEIIRSRCQVISVDCSPRPTQRRAP